LDDAELTAFLLADGRADPRLHVEELMEDAPSPAVLQLLLDIPEIAFDGSGLLGKAVLAGKYSVLPLMLSDARFNAGSLQLEALDCSRIGNFGCVLAALFPCPAYKGTPTLPKINAILGKIVGTTAEGHLIYGLQKYNQAALSILWCWIVLHADQVGILAGFEERISQNFFPALGTAEYDLLHQHFQAQGCPAVVLLLNKRIQERALFVGMLGLLPDQRHPHLFLPGFECIMDWAGQW